MADNLPDVYLKFTDSDPDIRGESMDAAYPADDGWLCLQSFNFGFGWGGTGSAGGGGSNTTLDDLRNQLAAEPDPKRRVQIQSRINALERNRPASPGQNGQAHPSTSQPHQSGHPAAHGDDGAQQLKQKEFRFTKSP